MAETSQRPIVVRRKKRQEHESHGGAWKIAYADFVTAMMAFFLLMWLLGSTTKGELQGIAEYFKNPLKVSLSGGSGTGDSTSVIKMGGGRDLTRAEGQFHKGHTREPQKKSVNVKPERAGEEGRELERLRELKLKLEATIESAPSLKQFKRQLLLDITDEGLRIQIVDEENRPMFAVGKAVLQPYMRQILREIATVLNEVPYKLSLAGHTDASRYAGGERGYSNWELSADRANASRRELIAGGLAEGKVIRVVGLASSALFDKTDPLNPVNRRISLVVLNKEAEMAMSNEAKALPVEGANELTPEQLGTGGVKP